MGRPDRANPDPENDACRRPSHSQAPAMRRPARTAKPQGRIPEHEASFQTRGPNRSRRRREQERRISRSNKKVPDCRDGRASMHPSRPLGAGLGCWPFGPAGPAFGRAARPAVARGKARFQRAVSPVGAAGRRSRARPAVPSEAVHAPLVVVHDARIDRFRQDDRRLLIGVSANQA